MKSTPGAKNRGGNAEKKLNANYIKRSINPVEFYKHELPGATIKRFGWNDGGICPFHTDKKIGSFKINTDTGAFKCFSCNSVGGDIIAFTRASHNLSFIEALAKLADDWRLA